MHRTDEHGRKEFRERDAAQDREREKERRQREKERIRRQDEERRRRRERQDGETMSKKQEEEVKREKKKCENVGDPSERVGKPAKDGKKEDGGKRERLRNKVTVAAFHQIVRTNIFVTCFLGFRTDLPFNCTNQGRGAATGLWERGVTPALLTGNQSRSLRKWPIELMTEQISACDTSRLARRERADRPALAHSGDVVQRGHSLQLCPCLGWFLEPLVPECDPSLFSFVRKVSRKLWI